MPYSGPYQAPKTWREFLIRVATIAVAAAIILGAVGLFQYLQDKPRTPQPIHSDAPADQLRPMGE